jgi:hypothetical protein
MSSNPEVKAGCDQVLWYYGSSAAIPFFTLVALLALWFGVSVPLTFVGAYFGFRKPSIEQPVRTNQIPRQIPDQSIYTQVVAAFLLFTSEIGVLGGMGVRYLTLI